MVDKQTAEARTAMPERGNMTRDVILMILAWFTISPFIMLINKNERYFKNWVMWLIILGSPLVGNLLVALLIPMFGMICLAEYVGYVFSLGDINSMLNLSAYPELTQFSNNPAILFLELMCLSIYAACVCSGNTHHNGIEIFQDERNGTMAYGFADVCGSLYGI